MDDVVRAERRVLAVLTTGRQDYGILRSTLLLLRDDPRFNLRLYVGGMHLKERFGRSVQMVHDDGLEIARTLDFVDEPPAPVADAARAVSLTGAALERDRPEALVLVGDRFETLAAGLAATLMRVPIVHLHGGEETEGAIDNSMRHALTKLSHLHLVSHGDHAERVLQMGEDPAHVVVVGAAGLDNRYRTDLPDRHELERGLGFSLAGQVAIVTVHPTTLAVDSIGAVSAIAAAMASVPCRYVVTQPNADEGGAAIRAFWDAWAAGRPDVRVVEALGERRYWGLLRCAAVVLGNSSSGLIEAPACGVPVVNVGDRQKGRLRPPALVRDVGPDSDAIRRALLDALGPAAEEWREAARAAYPEGPAARRIIEAIARWQPTQPPRKAFVPRDAVSVFQ